ncbi:MAG: peptidase vanX D-ala-D-ala dipeptidase [Flavipsychrobacter sp.]|jgi:D-alanyl-D-alanine dipeptidase|nr:peptidase vanX D-ala-D-ala dipeptidase [Flavipsychrobacter sp.]
MRLLFLFQAIFLHAFICAGQSCKTDAKYVNTKETFLNSIKDDPGKRLVALKQVIPGLVIDLRYATTNNFTKTVLYRNPVVYLRETPARSLKLAQEELNKKGLALKVYDAFRPFSVTCKMWRLIGDRRYVANPRKGSFHNRGIAIDVTLIGLHTGKELDMGTGYDCFTDSAHHDFYKLAPQVLANRKLLRDIMRKYGFGMVPEEWWHYQWRYNRESYEVIDLDFDELKDIVQ